MARQTQGVLRRIDDEIADWQEFFAPTIAIAGAIMQDEGSPVSLFLATRPDPGHTEELKL
jgi:hypothetical protein